MAANEPASDTASDTVPCQIPPQQVQTKGSSSLVSLENFFFHGLIANEFCYK